MNRFVKADNAFLDEKKEKLRPCSEIIAFRRFLPFSSGAGGGVKALIEWTPKGPPKNFGRVAPIHAGAQRPRLPIRGTKCLQRRRPQKRMIFIAENASGRDTAKKINNSQLVFGAEMFKKISLPPSTLLLGTAQRADLDRDQPTGTRVFSPPPRSPPKKYRVHLGSGFQDGNAMIR